MSLDDTILDDAKSRLGGDLTKPASPVMAPAEPVQPRSVAGAMLAPKTPAAPPAQAVAPGNTPAIQNPAYTVPAKQASVTTPKPETSGSPIPIVPHKVFATGYSPQKMGDKTEGDYRTSVPGPDGAAIARTLDDVRTGASKYVTLAGDPSLYGRSYIIPSVTFTKDGQQHTLQNVIGIVHDTGSAFQGAPEGRFDIAVARDLNQVERNQDMSHAQFVPNQAPLPQDIARTMMPPGGPGGQQYAQNAGQMNDASPGLPSETPEGFKPIEQSNIPEAVRKAMAAPQAETPQGFTPVDPSALPEAVRKAMAAPEAKESPELAAFHKANPREDLDNAEKFLGIPDAVKPKPPGIAETLGIGNPFKETGKAFGESRDLVNQGARDIETAGGKYWPGLLTNQGVVGAGKMLAGTAGAALSPITGATEALINKPVEKLDPTLAEGMRRGEMVAPLGYGGPGARMLAGSAERVAKEADTLHDIIKSAKGTEAKTGAEELRSGIGQEAKSVMKTQDEASKAASATAKEKTARLAEIEEEAKAAGLKAEDAKKYVEAKETEIKAAEDRATKLVDEFRARPTMSASELGNKISKAATEDMEALKKIRAEKSGFDKAINSDRGAPSILTADFSKRIIQMEKEAVDPQMKDTLGWLKSSLKTPINKKPTDAVSISRMRETIEVLNDRIDNALPSTANKLEKLRDDLVNHMETLHPDVKKAREEYARLSRPLDTYRNGALVKATKIDPYRKEPVADSTKIVGSLLSSGEDGAEALGRLIAKDPTLKDSAQKYFNERLFGPPGAERKVTPDTFGTFLRSNAEALKRSGLTKEFSDLRQLQVERKAEVEASKVTAQEAKVSEKQASEALKPIEERRKETEKTVGDMAKLKFASDDAVRELDRFDTKLRSASSPKEIYGEAKSTLEKLYKDHGLSGADYEKFTNQIKEVETSVKDTEEARKRLTSLVRAAAVAGLGAIGVTGAGYYISHRLQ